MFLRRASDVLRASGIDGVRSFGVTLAAVDVRVGSGEYDPIGPCAGDQRSHLREITDVGVC